MFQISWSDFGITFDKFAFSLLRLKLIASVDRWRIHFVSQLSRMIRLNFIQIVPYLKLNKIYCQALSC